MADAALPTTKPSASTSNVNANGSAGTKRDFFGRILIETSSDDECVIEGAEAGAGASAGTMNPKPRTKPKSRISAVEEEKRKREARVWVSYHEGFSNAVRKPVTLKEILSGL